MREFNIDYNKTFKPVLIVYLSIFLIGIIMACIFGVNLDINFSGGTKISYSYTGDIDLKKIESTTKTIVDKSFTITQSTSLAGDTQTFEIALVGKDGLYGHKKYFEVQPKRKVLHVVVIVGKARLYAVGLSAVHGSPPRNARARVEASLFLLGVFIPRLGIVGQHGPGPDQRHISLENIDELRKLVYARCSDKAPNLSHALVALNAKNAPLHLLGTRAHGAELIHLVNFAALADTLLREDNGALGFELDCDCDNQKNGR
jgi:hypothetical protein